MLGIMLRSLHGQSHLILTITKNSHNTFMRLILLLQPPPPPQFTEEKIKFGD